MAEEAPVLDQDKQPVGTSVGRRLRRVVTVTLFSLVGPVAIGAGALRRCAQSRRAPDAALPVRARSSGR